MRILLLADLHVGSIKDVNYYYDVVTEIIDKEINFTHCDAVILLGDYFDRLFKVNEEYVSLAINVMSYLIRSCYKGKTKIRIVYGTESHEMNQYKLFNYHFSSSQVDIKLITSATEEELFPGINVLYLPEEYINDKHEFYQHTLYEKHYQFIFGHGVIVEGMPAAVTATRSDDGEKHVPHFKSGELAAASDLTFFGHQHTFFNYENRVYYIGSLFRRSFGEEIPKGYGIVEDGKFTFVENEKAYIYDTYEYDEDSDIFKSSDNIIREINRFKEKYPKIFSGEQIGKIRMIFHIPKNVSADFKENLKNVLFHDKHISALLKEPVDDIIQEIEEENDEFAFIIDNSLPIADKIYRFISKQYEDEISIDDLIRYINEPLFI